MCVFGLSFIMLLSISFYLSVCFSYCCLVSFFFFFFLLLNIWCQFHHLHVIKIPRWDENKTNHKKTTLRTIGMMMMLIMLSDYTKWNIGNHKVADNVLLNRESENEIESKAKRWTKRKQKTTHTNTHRHIYYCKRNFDWKFQTNEKTIDNCINFHINVEMPKKNNPVFLWPFHILFHVPLDRLAIIFQSHNVFLVKSNEMKKIIIKIKKRNRKKKLHFYVPLMNLFFDLKPRFIGQGKSQRSIKKNAPKSSIRIVSPFTFLMSVSSSSSVYLFMFSNVVYVKIVILVVVVVVIFSSTISM